MAELLHLRFHESFLPDQAFDAFWESFVSRLLTLEHPAHFITLSHLISPLGLDPILKKNPTLISKIFLSMADNKLASAAHVLLDSILLHDTLIGEKEWVLSLIDGSPILCL